MNDTGPESRKQIKKLPDSELAAATARDDNFGAKEAKQLSQDLSPDQLKKIAEQNEAERDERFREHFERIAITGLHIFAVLFLAITLAWAFHILAPKSWHWLEVAELEKLQALLTGGIVASIGLGHIKRRLGK